MSGGQRVTNEVREPVPDYAVMDEHEDEPQQDSIYLSIIGRCQQKVCSITYRLAPALTSNEEKKTNPVANTKIEHELLILEESLDEIISRLVI
ncbi:MAG TPA: hypothetical protein VMW91_04025 [Desulfosporosinus sp.]|nr:hypothetical protein [Desulfosporosinus sp.]